MTPDRERIEAALAAMAAHGIIGKADYQCCRSCATYALGMVERGNWAGPGEATGYVFFHGQDTDGANEGHSLFLGYGSFGDKSADDANVARLAIQTLKEHGFTPYWNGDCNRRIEVPPPGRFWELDYERTPNVSDFDDDDEEDE